MTGGTDEADATNDTGATDEADAITGTGEPDELRTLVRRVPVGWSEVAYDGRSWGLTRTDHGGGASTTLYAEQLGGTAFVSANVWHTSGGDVLRPCEMPAEVVLDLLRGWTPTAPPPEE